VEAGSWITRQGELAERMLRTNALLAATDVVGTEFAWFFKVTSGQGNPICMADKFNLRRAVSDELVKSGFDRIERVLMLPVNNDFSLWVDTGPLGSRADIAPFIGIRHEGVENLRARLLGTTSLSTAGTVGANVGYVLGVGYRSWEAPSSASEVVTMINTGLDRLRGYTSLKKLVAAWELEGSKRPGWQFSRIATQLASGDIEGAKRSLDAAALELCRYQDEVCAEFQDFKIQVSNFANEIARH